MIKETLEKIIEKAAGKSAFLEHPENPEYGDYATNIALVLAKKQKKDPREIAEAIVANFNIPALDFIEKVEVAGPGFINFFLKKDFLIKELLKIAKQKEKYGSDKSKKKIIIEYSSPNIAKPFGIGHLRSTIIGQAIYNLYKFLGYKCIGINYPGDWGTPHGAIIYQLREKLLKNKTIREKKRILENLTIKNLEELYVEFVRKTKKEPKLQEKARFWFKKLEQKDKEARFLWEYTRKISFREFQRIYDLLNVHHDFVIGESFFEDKMEAIVEEFKKKGLAKKSKGALIVPFSQDALPPGILLKSDGATTYFTRDLANMQYRIKRWKPDIIVIETGAEQILHFKQVFLAAKLVGMLDHTQLVHIHHGLYISKEGKFSTRRGRTVHLELVLREAIERAKKIIEQSETARGLSKDEINAVAKAVGIGAVKYNDLSQHPSHDILFDWEKILNLKGNSAPYLQYTFARCKSILKKSGQSLRQIFHRVMAQIPSFSKEELSILRTAYKFTEVVKEAAKSFSPNLVANFAFDLAQKFNLFYNTHRVLDAKTQEQKNFRLLLTLATAQLLENSLSLLGIETPEKM